MFNTHLADTSTANKQALVKLTTQAGRGSMRNANGATRPLVFPARDPRSPARAIAFECHFGVILRTSKHAKSLIWHKLV